MEQPSRLEIAAWSVEIAVSIFFLFLLLTGCTAEERTKLKGYAYVACKVRDLDPVLHQTFEGFVPLSGLVVGAGCIVVETYYAPPAAPLVPPPTPVVQQKLQEIN